MKRYRLTAIHAAAKRRKPGYLEAVMEAGTVNGEWLEMLDCDAERIGKEYRLDATKTEPHESKPCTGCLGL